MTTRETLDVLNDEETLADLRQSAKDIAEGDTFTVEEVRAEFGLER